MSPSPGSGSDPLLSPRQRPKPPRGPGLDAAAPLLGISVVAPWVEQDGLRTQGATSCRVGLPIGMTRLPPPTRCLPPPDGIDTLRDKATRRSKTPSGN